MLIGIVKNKDNDYYIHLKQNKICVFHNYKNIIKPLSRIEAITLYNKLFSSKLRYLTTEDDYKVYIDKSNNKRYIKDNIEDLNKFFSINGKDALIYDKDINNKKDKLVNTLVKVLVLEYTITMLIPLTFSSHKDLTYSEIAFYSEYNEMNAEDISINDLKELLYNSNNLSLEDKDFLYNEELLKLVLRISSNNRNYSIREKFNNINVKFFSKEEDTRSEKINGYYNPVEPSTLYLRDDNLSKSNKYNDVLSHEFIHLLQTNNKYTYINEGSAEILSNEYYGQVNNSYNEIVKRVKILMEIIGPKPVIECNFNTNIANFESYIARYLNEDDKIELLKLFEAENIDLCETDEVKELNKSIDKLLSKMYFNKTGKSIEEDTMISILYTACIDDRYYFNNTSDKYRDGYILYHNREDLDEIPLEEVLNSPNVVKYVWHKNHIFIKDNKEIHGYTLIETTDFNEINGERNEFVIVEFNDGTKGEIRYNYDLDNWSNVYRYKPIPIIEPSIEEKFPGQCQELNIYNEAIKVK